MVKKYYEILELPENCQQIDIKKNYKKMALKWHPDRNKDNKDIAGDNNIDLHVPKGRQKHNDFLNNHVENKALSDSEKERKAFYARRKSTIEPIFGVVKSVIGFTKFSLRGIDAVTSEWSLVCIAYNLKRLCVLKMKTA